MDEQRAQIAITAFADPVDVLLAATGMNSRRQTEPSCEVPRRLELPSVADAGDDRIGGDRPHPWGGGKPVAGLRVSVPGHDPCLNGINPHAQCIDMIERLGNRGAGLGRQQIAANFVHPLSSSATL